MPCTKLAIKQTNHNILHLTFCTDSRDEPPLSLFSSIFECVPRTPAICAFEKKNAKNISSVCNSSSNHHPRQEPSFSSPSPSPFLFPLSSQISIFQQYRDRTHLTPHRLESCLFLKLTMTNCHRNAAVLVHVDVDYLEHVTLEAGIYGRPNRVLRTATRHFGAKFELFESLLFIFFFQILVFCTFHSHSHTPLGWGVAIVDNENHNCTIG